MDEKRVGGVLEAKNTGFTIPVKYIGQQIYVTLFI